MLFLFFPIFIFSQSKVSVKVVDDNNEAVSRVIVIVMQGDDQIAFGTTNNDGVFEKNLTSGSYVFNVKKLGFTAIVN